MHPTEQQRTDRSVAAQFTINRCPMTFLIEEMSATIDKSNFVPKRKQGNAKSERKTSKYLLVSSLLTSNPTSRQERAQKLGCSRDSSWGRVEGRGTETS